MPFARIVPNSTVNFPLTTPLTDGHKFRVYGISFLLATPSHFGQVIVPQGSTAINNWLISVGVTDPNSQEILQQFVKLFTSNVAPSPAVTTFRDALLRTFGINTEIPAYIGPICPNQQDSMDIMRGMVALDQASGAGGSAAAA